MDEHTATELAFKNGYDKCKKEYECEFVNFAKDVENTISKQISNIKNQSLVSQEENFIIISFAKLRTDLLSIFNKYNISTDIFFEKVKHI